MNTPSSQLKQHILQILRRLEVDGGSGHIPSFPKFDFYALDYLEFAELNLEAFLRETDIRKKDNELISCVSNLKRALDNQI